MGWGKGIPGRKTRKSRNERPGECKAASQSDKGPSGLQSGANKNMSPGWEQLLPMHVRQPSPPLTMPAGHPEQPAHVFSSLN